MSDKPKTPAEQQPPDPATPVVSVEASDIVAALTEALKQVGPAAEEQKALKAVVDGIAKLGADGLAALAQTPAFQAAIERVSEQQAALADAPAGSYIAIKQGDKVRRIKKPWTRKEMEQRYPMQTQTAWRSGKVIVNGVQFRVTQGEEQTLPACVWQVLRDSDREKKLGDLWVERWFGTDQKMGASGYYGSVLLGHGYTLDPGDVDPALIASAQPPAAAAAS